MAMLMKHRYILKNCFQKPIYTDVHTYCLIRGGEHDYIFAVEILFQNLGQSGIR